MNRIQETDLILNPDGSVYHLNLLPHHLSDLIIAVGDPDRVSEVSKYFERVEFVISKREFITHVGYYNGKRITVVSSGIGTDNVEILLTELDALANINLATRQALPTRQKLRIIRIGTSGALQEDIPPGSHLVSDYAVGFDNLTSFYELEGDVFERELAADLQRSASLPFTPYLAKGSEVLKRQFAFDMISGNTVTCPGFYAPQGRLLRIPLKYPKLLESLTNYRSESSNFRLANFEMETSAYYAFGRLMGHEILSVNAIIVNRRKNEFSPDPRGTVEELIKKILSRI